MWNTAFVVLIVFSAVNIVVCGRGSDKHIKNISCYSCHTLYDPEYCHQTNNQSVFEQQLIPKAMCSISEPYCQVRRFSFSGNGTVFKVWMMERGCASVCVNECVIAGDRSKLHLCTSCCDKNFCNVGDHAALRSPHSFLIFVCFLLFNFCNVYQRLINCRV